MPPYLRLVLGIGLLERLEDDLLLLRRNADAGIGDLERDDGRRLTEDRVIRAPAADRRRDVQPHAALLGELERVRQQVLEHLLQRLESVVDAAPEIGVDLHVEGQLPGFGLVPERPRDRRRAGSRRRSPRRRP